MPPPLKKGKAMHEAKLRPKQYPLNTKVQQKR